MSSPLQEPFTTFLFLITLVAILRTRVAVCINFLLGSTNRHSSKGYAGTIDWFPVCLKLMTVCRCAGFLFQFHCFVRYSLLKMHKASSHTSLLSFESSLCLLTIPGFYSYPIEFNVFYGRVMYCILQQSQIQDSYWNRWLLFRKKVW